jgi:hypothetical protein
VQHMVGQCQTGTWDLAKSRPNGCKENEQGYSFQARVEVILGEVDTPMYIGKIMTKRTYYIG